MTISPFADECMKKEKEESEAFLRQFFQCYFMDRDAEQTLPMLSEQVIFIGIAAQEKAIGRGAFLRLLAQQLEPPATQRQYELLDFVQIPCGPHSWNCFVDMETRSFTDQGVQLRCSVQLTVALHWEGDRWLIDMLHASEASAQHCRKEVSSASFIEQTAQRFKGTPNDALWSLIDQIVPGGVVGQYIADGFPLVFANEQFFKMTGFRNYDEFHSNIGGQFIDGIHPQDRGLVTEKIQTALTMGKQYEVEYRIQQKDGGYLWVHNIGRKTFWHDGREAIISVLIDISRQVDERQKLELENGIDSLTGVYNRKGAGQRISQITEEDTRWLYCIIDLDNFKKVNDVYGHKQGDQILCYVADQLKSCFGQMGIVYRMGGDEFAMFIPQYDDMETIAIQIHQVMEEYAGFLQEECPNTESTLSVGGIYGKGRPDVEEIYERADKNLYRVKDNGKAGICLTMIGM